MCKKTKQESYQGREMEYDLSTVHLQKVQSGTRRLENPHSTGVLELKMGQDNEPTS